MTSGSPPRKPHATFAEETIFSISASLPVVQAPKLSPMSQLRSITSIAVSSSSGGHSGMSRRDRPGTHEHGPKKPRTTVLASAAKAGVHGFRVRGLAAPRNDD